METETKTKIIIVSIVVVTAIILLYFRFKASNSSITPTKEQIVTKKPIVTKRPIVTSTPVTTKIPITTQVPIDYLKPPYPEPKVGFNTISKDISCENNCNAREKTTDLIGSGPGLYLSELYFTGILYSIEIRIIYKPMSNATIPVNITSYPVFLKVKDGNKITSLSKFDYSFQLDLNKKVLQTKIYPNISVLSTDYLFFDTYKSLVNITYGLFKFGIITKK